MKTEFNQRKDKFGLMPTVATAYFGGGGGGGGGSSNNNNNTQVALAGNLIDRRSDGITTICTYASPNGGITKSVVQAGNSVCPPTAPLPRG